MTRRFGSAALLWAATAAAASLLASSCSTVDPPAATVNGERISMDRFESYAGTFTEFQMAQGALAPMPEGIADGLASRNVLGFMIQTELLTQEVRRTGGSISEANRTAGRTQLADSSPTFDTLPDGLQALLLEQAAAEDALREQAQPSMDELRDTYEQGIAASGVACVSHILVETEADAEAVLARLDEGEDFAAVAADASTDPGSGAAGGVLSGDQGACFDLASFSNAFIPEFVQGALDAEVGIPSRPVQSQFGYHIILVRPFDEVSEDVAAATAASASATVRARLFESAEIEVNNSIGAWDPASSAVVALDQVPADA